VPVRHAPTGRCIISIKQLWTNVPYFTSFTALFILDRVRMIFRCRAVYFNNIFRLRQYYFFHAKHYWQITK